MALLPFYARITATLGQVFLPIADGVVAGLERSFRYYKVRLATAQCRIVVLCTGVGMVSLGLKSCSCRLARTMMPGMWSAGP